MGGKLIVVTVSIPSPRPTRAVPPGIDSYCRRFWLLVLPCVSLPYQRGGPRNVQRIFETHSWFTCLPHRIPLVSSSLFLPIRYSDRHTTWSAGLQTHTFLTLFPPPPVDNTLSVRAVLSITLCRPRADQSGDARPDAVAPAVGFWGSHQSESNTLALSPSCMTRCIRRASRTLTGHRA